MPSSRGYSRPRDRTQVSCASCIAGRFFTCWAIREVIKTCTRQTRKYTYIYIRHTYICKYICMYVYMYTCICIMHLLSMYACLYIHFNAVWQIKQKKKQEEGGNKTITWKKEIHHHGPIGVNELKSMRYGRPCLLKKSNNQQYSCSYSSFTDHLPSSSDEPLPLSCTWLSPNSWHEYLTTLGKCRLFWKPSKPIACVKSLSLLLHGHKPCKLLWASGH